MELEDGIYLYRPGDGWLWIVYRVKGNRATEKQVAPGHRISVATMRGQWRGLLPENHPEVILGDLDYLATRPPKRPKSRSTWSRRSPIFGSG